MTAPSSAAVLARRFRALWVFRQALLALGADGPDAARLQALQARLRSLANDADGATVAAVADELDAVRRELLAADAAIPPSQLRRFLQRAASYDDAVLLQLVEVYLAGRELDGWPGARLDKLGYLLTRLAERRRRPGSPLGLDQRARLRDAFAWIWTQVGGRGDGAEVEAACRALEAARGEIARVASLAELRERRVVSRYRDLKASLGELLFHPDVLVASLETNLALKDAVHALFRREESRIFTDSEMVLELEADLTDPAALAEPGLREELAQFHAAVRRFEEQLRADDLKIDEAADLHAQALGLLQRIGEQVGP